MRNTRLDVKAHAVLVAQPAQRDHKATREWMLDPVRLDRPDQLEAQACPERQDHKDHPARRAAMAVPVRMPNTARARNDRRAALVAALAKRVALVVAVLGHTVVKHKCTDNKNKRKMNGVNE